MGKIFVEVTKEGEVLLDAEGFQGNACMNNPKLKNLIDLIQKEGEINQLEKLFQEEKQKIAVENII